MNHEIAKNQQMAATHRELLKYPRIRNALVQKRNKPGLQWWKLKQKSSAIT
jgi:hypothetical protein